MGHEPARSSSPRRRAQPPTRPPPPLPLPPPKQQPATLALNKTKTAVDLGLHTAALKLTPQPVLAAVSRAAYTHLVPPPSLPLLQSSKKITNLAASINITKNAIVDQVALKLKPATVDAAAPRYTGTVTCFVDDATGDVAGLQLGTAPALCSATGTAHSFVVPADGYIADVKVAVDKATGLVGELVFVVASNSKLTPAQVFSCGKKGGLAVSVTPKLSAVSSVGAGCKAAPAGGRRLTQAIQLLDPTAMTWTVTTVKVCRERGARGRK